MDEMARGFCGGGDHSAHVGRDFLATLEIARFPGLFGDVCCWIRFAMFRRSNVARQFPMGENALRMVA